MSPKQILSLLKQTYAKWSEHQAPRLGASVAFYSILSFAPLLVLITTVIALVLGHENAQGALVNEARQLIGDRGAETAETLLKNAQKPSSGIFAGLVAFVTLLFGASGVFTELQDALNTMWEVKAKDADSVFGMIKQRLFSFGMVLSVGFLLLVSLVLSTALAYIGKSFQQILPLPEFVLNGINFVVSFLVIATLFALMFRYVPAVKVAWREVIIGAIGTALLFTIGKFGLGLYLGKASVGSTYGAAGSLVAVVVWIYYSAQIFFFGAEFTHVYAEARDPKLKAASQAAAAEPSSAMQENQSPAGAAQSAPELLRMAAAAGGRQSLEGSIARTQAPAPSLSQAPPITAPEPQLPLEPVARREIQPPVVVHPVPQLVEGGYRPLEKTKPKLLMSLAVGFALGRMTRTSTDRPEIERLRS